MGGAAPDMAFRKRLRSHDSDRIEIRSDDDEEGNKMRGGVSEVKNGKASTAAILEKGKQKEGRATSSKNMMADVREKEKKTASWNGHNKLKSRKKVSTASLEKMRKKEKLCNANNKKKMQICDDEEGKNRRNRDYNLKNRKESTTISEKKNKEKMNKTHKEKMMAADSKERKKMSGHNGVKKSGEVFTAFFGNGKEGERLNKNTEKETAPLTPAVKKKRMRPSERNEMTMLHDKPNGRNVPSNVSKEKKMDTSSGSNYRKRKREEPHSLSKKEKRVWGNASDKKIYSGTMQEKKICGSGKEKNRQAPFAFFKFIYNYFEEFLRIPPAVAPKLEDLTNHDVYLEDSEKRHSKVRLSVVDGSLAFHQGWDIFVSDHLIKRGEFLVFEYTARKRFYVRIFGIDSCERLHFTKDPKRVEQGIGHGPPQDNNNGSLIDRQCKTKDTSPLHCKRETVILIPDSGTSEQNEDILNVTSDADSTHHMTININKDPKRVQSGVGNLPDGVCGTKCISPPCSEGKTSSEITVTDAAPLKHESDGRVGHELEKHDLDEDLMRKQGINSIPSDSITAVEEHQNHCETIVSQNIYRKFGAPGGFRCLEKWTKAIVNSPAALDGTVPIKPENTRKTGSQLVDGCGSIGPNTDNEYFCSKDHHTLVLPVFTMPVKEPLSADRVSKFRHVGTNIDHSINKKGGGAAVQIQMQGEQLETVGSIVNSQNNNIPMSANTEVLGKYGALGRNAAGPEGTCASIEPMLTVPVEKPLSPDGISKCGSSRTEIYHNVNGKGTIVQLEKNMDQVEAVGSSACSQSSNVAMHANHVVVPESEHFFSIQEGRKSVNCAITESLLPVKDKILELDGHSLQKFSLQLCIPDTTRRWLELPKSLSKAVNKQKRHDRNVIMLKDPMNRLWPVLYHENPVFVGFTAGWNHFVAGNDLQTGDLCKLTKEADDDKPVFCVQITKRRL